MIEKIANLPDTMVGFRAAAEVTASDFEKVVVPAVNELVKRTNNLNYLMVIDTSLNHFTSGAWLQDALLGLKKLTKWNKVAILSDSEGIKRFTDIFSVVSPGEFKGFNRDDLSKAVTWIQTN
jgi:hypothetical protein